VVAMMKRTIFLLTVAVILVAAPLAGRATQED
jgi:predicted small secreted protein